MVLLLLPRPAGGHTPGLSMADFTVRTDGQVEARLTFASADQLGGLALDRDGDGAVTADDVSAARKDLRAFLVQGVTPQADGSSGPPVFRDASLSEVDGLLLRATYGCPIDAADIEVTLYYLSGGPQGQPGAASRARRGIARIEAAGATTEAVLTGEHRAIALHLAGKGGAGRRHARRAGMLAVVAILVGLLAYGSWRWRSARAACDNPTL